MIVYSDGNIQFDSYSSHFKVVILIIATTLMHKSTLNTNHSGNNHFGQKYQKQNNLRIFRL